MKKRIRKTSLIHTKRKESVDTSMQKGKQSLCFTEAPFIISTANIVGKRRERDLWQVILM